MPAACPDVGIQADPLHEAASLSNPQETWEIWWCYDGWHAVADRLETLLPAWAKLLRMDPKRPLHEQVGAARVLIPTTGLVDRASIYAATHVKLIAQPAAGYNNIDTAAARERGVPITLAPGVNSHAVAEVALCMMLMLSRRIDEARLAFERGVIGEPVGRQLAGKRLGVVGRGRVGNCLASAAQGMGMQVVGVTSKSTRAELEHLLSTSDVVSLHTPLTPRTQGLIGKAELDLMKPDALLINCSRGSVVDKQEILRWVQSGPFYRQFAMRDRPLTQALVAALSSGRLGGVGLDCHWVEPADPHDPLYRHPKVLALPHMGSIAEEVYLEFAEILAANIMRMRAGEPLLHVLAND